MHNVSLPQDPGSQEAEQHLPQTDRKFWTLDDPVKTPLRKVMIEHSRQAIRQRTEDGRRRVQEAHQDVQQTVMTQPSSPGETLGVCVPLVKETEVPPGPPKLPGVATERGDLHS